jgi:putative hydrolase of the HAD superfamily
VKLPDAVLLDLDDTIVAFDAVADRCWLSLCERYVGELPGMTADRLSQSVSRAREWFWSDVERHRLGRRDLRLARRKVVQRALDELGVYREDVATRLADDYSEARERFIELLPGAMETIVELRRRGVVLGLITNGESRAQRAKIERFDLARHFAYVLIEGEFGVGKPDHAVFNEVLNALGCQPREAWMIGDSLTFDISPALALGIEAIWVDRLGRGLPNHTPCTPNRIVSSMADIFSDADREHGKYIAVRSTHE